MTRIGKVLCFQLWVIWRIAVTAVAIVLILMAIHNNQQFMRDEDDA